jgi:ubiquinone/menaquinone biosynthesis C-methylase UbiE
MALTIEEVYDKISYQFDYTRHRIWGSVKKFLNSLESESNVLEIGCGNGKNMLYRNDLHFTGIDISQGQVDICKKKNLNVFKENMTNLSFGNNSFDNIICIATYHHLDNDNDRRKALDEIYRVLKVGGKVLITVWSMEQESDSNFSFNSSDTMVPWKCRTDGITYQRYYHIYKKGELEEEISRLCPLFKVVDLVWELGNWVVVLEKSDKDLIDNNLKSL